MTIYEIVTERICTQLEAGVIPWVKPWREYGPYRNYVSRKPYRGINTLLLSGMPYICPYWATFRQITERKQYIKAGEKGSMIVFFHSWYEDAHGNRSPEKKPGYTERWALKYYRVWNIEQTTIPWSAKENGIPPSEYASAERILEGYVPPRGPRIQQDAEAWYALISDTVGIPPKEAFHQIDGYYSALFHELVHSTGHESRIGREMKNHFGSERYSKEELIAEIGAAFLCARAGIESTIENSAAYIQNWMKALRDDTHLIVNASAAAQKAADYIINEQAEEKGDAEEERSAA
jgi:antirestriction protein ArdC